MKSLHSLTLVVAAAVLLTFINIPVHAAGIDSRIESSARQSYVFKTYLLGDTITIQSSDGAVTLTGIVSENFHKSLAQETVSGLTGVKSVDNRLEVKGAAPTANSDAWLRDKVNVALSFHKSVSAASTTVDVKDGVVTLRGDVASQIQKELTAEYARDVEGIRGVKNELTVSRISKRTPRTVGEKIDDASITAQVNMTLLNHRTTSVLNTTVMTKRGVVTVGGKTGNSAERKLVTKLVSDIHGVTKVKNRMTIE
jgi:osmotically-inducible protein OsmY